MNEEEKKAYNYLKRYIKWETLGERNLEGDINTILILVEKQRRIIKTRTKEIESLYKMMSVKDDELEKLKDKIKELREIDNIDLIQFKLKELLGE